MVKEQDSDNFMNNLTDASSTLGGLKEEDYGTPVTWNFSATGHGKGKLLKCNICNIWSNLEQIM